MPLSDNFGTVQKMVETGYHTPEVWKSVLFQLVYACAVLQEKEIAFEKFSLENNVFIKDLFTNSEKRDHWIYKVGDYEFFFPNYVYLLMIDSRFVDVKDEDHQVYVGAEAVEESEGPTYKIQSQRLYSDKNNRTDLKDFIYYQFKDMINPDNFNNNLERLGGERPDETILLLLEQIYNDTDSERKIVDLLKTHFPEFMNNRVGTLLTHEEKNILSLIPRFDFKSGDIIVHQVRYQEYRWAIYVGNGNNKKIIITSEDDRKTFRELEVYGHSLFKFPEGERINKIYNGINFDSNFTIETYNFNSSYNN